MNVLRITASMDPAMGGPPQGIRNSIAELERLGIRSEAVCCDAPHSAWLGKDSFPVHALGPGNYGFAYTPKLGPWLEENLLRFDAVIVHGLWLWPSTCAVRAIARERARRAAGGGPDGVVSPPQAERTEGAESLNVQHSTLNSKQLRCFVMPHGMLDPWFQRDNSRRVKAVRNWFYWWFVERGVVNSADALLFTCQQELELARTTFGSYRPKREINVGYGIAEPPAFEPKMQEAFAARCPSLYGRPYLLFMSRVHPKKNVAALVRAYARIAREHEAWSMEHGAKQEESKAEKSFSHSRAQRDGTRRSRGQIDTEPSKDFSHGLGRIREDGSERLAADRPGENAAGPVTRAGDGQSQQNGKGHGAFPDLVIAGPGWESRYGEEVRMLIDEANETARAEAGGLRAEVGSASAQSGYGVTRDRTADGAAESARQPIGKPAATSTENCKLNTANSACVHAVAMLSGDAKWGALYGCEAFVLPSHQENFGIAVVEALACGKPVLISDQVNIWREIVEDGAGLVEGDTEGGVEKLLRRFLDARRDEGGGLRPEVGGRGEGNDECRMMNAEWRRTEGGGTPRECYLKRFAIGPAVRRLADALKG